MLRIISFSGGLLVAVLFVGATHLLGEDVPSYDRQDGDNEEHSVLVTRDEPRVPEDAGNDRVASELPVELQALRAKVRRCLSLYHRQLGDASRLTPWELMHASLAFGVDSQVYASGNKVNALGWLCWNGRGNGRRLLASPGGSLQVRQGYGVQGHEGQFLAILAQSKVVIETPLKVGGEEFTVADLVAHEQATCRADTELTFKLIGLVHYLDSDATWSSDDGQTWNIPRLIEEELKQPVVGSACGGAHRLTGFSYAVSKRVKRGEPLDGAWKRAQEYAEEFHEHAFKLQNDDGGFSTNWFAGRGDRGNSAWRINTTGHTLEWLVCSLPQDELRDPRMLKSVAYLADLLLENLDYDIEMGALGHALHALTLYDERQFGSTPGNRAETLQADVELAAVSG